jgi:hypothetical protein
MHLFDDAATGCQADQCVSSGESAVSFSAGKTETHYVVVDSASMTAGAVTLKVECADCEPKCDGKNCGPDACGGICGFCGQGLECTPKGTCIKPAENDTCATATFVDPDSLPFIVDGTTLGSSDDYGLPPDSGCAGSPMLSKGKGPGDTVYRMTPTTTGEYLLAVNANFNATLYVVTDCTDPVGNCVGVAEDKNGVDKLVTTLSKGVTYYVIVDGTGGVVSGNYTLTITHWPCQGSCTGKECGPNGCGGACGSCNAGFFCSENYKCLDEPVNDTCLEAFPLSTIPSSVTHNTAGAADDYFVYPEVCPGGPSFDVGGQGAPDVVYAFTPPFNGKYQVTVTPHPGFNALLSVRNACPGEIQDCIVGSDQPDIEQATFVRGQGKTVWFVVDGSGPGDMGTFDLKITQLPCTPQCGGKKCGSDQCGGVCGSCLSSQSCTDNGSCEFIPANDTCNTATVIDSLPFTSSTGSTEVASGDYLVLPSTCDGGPAAATYGGGNDVAFVYSSPVDQSVVFFFDKDLTFFNTFLYVVSDCADIAGTCLQAQDSPINGAESLVLPMTAGQTVYVIVDGWSKGSKGIFVLKANVFPGGG